MKLNTALPVNISRHGRLYVAYTPALDLSTSGKSLAEVKRRFGEIVTLFFEELQEAGTLHDVLTELGWQKQTGTLLSKSSAPWQPPRVTNSTFQVSVPVA